MIRGDTMYYTSEPAELRAFLRDKLGFPDVGGGWLPGGFTLELYQPHYRKSG